MWLDVSRQGIRIPYLRFLADASGGFLVIGLILLALYLPPECMPLDDSSAWVALTSHLAPLGAGLEVEVKVVFLILLFLIALPLGLALSGVSFYLLGWSHSYPGVLHWLRVRLERRMPKILRRPFTEPDIVSILVETTGGSMHDLASHFRKILATHAPHLLLDFQHVTGLRRLARSVSLIFLLIVADALPNPLHWPTSALLLAAVLSSLLALLVEYTECGLILFRVYTLLGIDAIRNLDQQDIAEFLAAKVAAITAPLHGKD